jgi:hypothetical protein
LALLLAGEMGMHRHEGQEQKQEHGWKMVSSRMGG